MIGLLDTSSFTERNLVETNTSPQTNDVSSSKVFWAAIIGIGLGYIISTFGIALGKAMQDGFEAIGVGFVAFCAAAAFDWTQLGRKRFVSIGAGFFFGLAVALSTQCTWPQLFWPFMNGIIFFMVGNIARMILTKTQKSPSS